MAEPTVNEIRLNLGCGEERIPGFVNIDIVPPADLVLDVRGGLPYADREVTEVIAHHFCEHLDFEGLRAVLNECHRLLGDGCVMNIRVPHALRAPDKAFGDPTHRTFWTPRTPRYWSAGDDLYARFGRRYGLLPWVVLTLETPTEIRVTQRPCREQP